MSGIAMLKAAKRFLSDHIAPFLERDPAARNQLEVFLLYPGLHAIIYYRLAHWLWARGWRFLARWLSQATRFFTGVEIHPGARIGERFFIDHGMGIVIGETAYIGHDVTIYHGVTLGGVSPTTEEAGAARHPQIGDGVIIGSGAQLLGPIEVSDYARIGSNAVVVRDVEPCATMVGIPARSVKVRGDDEAASTCFTAYAISDPEARDPIGARMDVLLDEIDQLRGRLNELDDANDDALDTAENWDKG